MTDNNLKTKWMCNTPKDSIIPAGFHVLMPSVWTFNKDGFTDYHDVRITLNEDTMAVDALSLLEKKAVKVLSEEGGMKLRPQYLTSIKVYERTYVFQYDD